MERAMGIEPTSEAWDFRVHGSSILLSRLSRFTGNASRINLPRFPWSRSYLNAEINGVAATSEPGPGTIETAFNLFEHNNLIAQKFTGKQIKWEVVTTSAAGRRGGDHITGGGVGDVSLSLHAGRGDESLPLRVFWRSDAGMPLHAAD